MNVIACLTVHFHSSVPLQSFGAGILGWCDQHNIICSVKIILVTVTITVTIFSVQIINTSHGIFIIIIIILVIHFK